MGSVVAGIALVGVLVGSTLIGAYVGRYEAFRWSAMAQRARRFVRCEKVPADEMEPRRPGGAVPAPAKKDPVNTGYA